MSTSVQFAVLVITCFALVTSSFASPSLLQDQFRAAVQKSTYCRSVKLLSGTVKVISSPSVNNKVKEAAGDSNQSVHMQIADRLLQRILDVTYETLQDIGASERDLQTVQRKRNYIQTCYFQAISCY